MTNPSAELLSCPSGVRGPGTPGEVRARLRDGAPFWLDLVRPGEAELRLLAEDFGVHPLVIEDTGKFGQRPKAEEYDDFLFVVAFGCTEDAEQLLELHCLVSARWLVTVHDGEVPGLGELRERFARHGRAPASPAMLLHGVLDALTDSFFPALATIDDRINVIEGVLAEDSAGDLQARIFRIKRRLVEISRVAGPQRDMLGRFAGGLMPVPGATPEAERYLRDVFDHAVRIESLTEVYRDLLTGATEVHLAAVSNRLNQVMKQLTVIATIFLPLTFLTGFFGQNFGWMVGHVGGLGQFLALGAGLQAATVAGLLLWFRRRRWI